MRDGGWKEGREENINMNSVRECAECLSKGENCKLWLAELAERSSRYDDDVAIQGYDHAFWLHMMLKYSYKYSTKTMISLLTKLNNPCVCKILCKKWQMYVKKKKIRLE